MTAHRKRTGDKAAPRERISASAQRKMRAAIAKEIRRYERCARLLVRVDPDVFSAGIGWLECESALVQWLCTPARALGDKVPLDVMRSLKGRKQVAQIMRALDQGTYL